MHRKRSQVAVINEVGEVLANRNVPNGTQPVAFEAGPDEPKRVTNLGAWMDRPVGGRFGRYRVQTI